MPVYEGFCVFCDKRTEGHTGDTPICFTCYSNNNQEKLEIRLKELEQSIDNSDIDFSIYHQDAED